MSSLRQGLSVLQVILRDPSNKGQRLFRLFLAISWQLYKRCVRLPIILPLDNGLALIADPAAGNSVGAIYTRVYESEYVFFCRKHIPEGAVMCDVGAHIGLFTLLLAPKLKKAVLFEPDPATFSLMVKNININGLGYAKSFNVAVSDTNGLGKLAVMGKYSGLTKLSRPGDTSLGNCVDTELVTLDDTLDRLGIHKIDFLKIDTEGHELCVLRGAVKTLSKSRDALVLFENQDINGILSLFHEINWRVFGINELGDVVVEKREIEKKYNLFACGPLHPLSLVLNEHS